MARLTKETLKGIFKECLREILKEEGIIQNLKENVKFSRSPSPMLNESVDDDGDDDQPQLNNEQEAVMLESIRSLSRGMGHSGKNANLYAELLADTALKTLPEQMSSDMTSQGKTGIPEVYTKKAQEKDMADLKSLTGGADLTRWSKVAFAKKD